MASQEQSKIQQFTQNWSKTAAWAQGQGIKYNSYYPVYQMDSQRLLANESPMSNAERTRAILAASNPKDVTPVPGDARDPTNIMSNTVTDLKNIFTGLEPTHLVSNIFDTVKNAIVHPSTWIKPLQDIAEGKVKQGLELASGLKGPGSILSWLPGVYVGGLAAQGGIGNVISHPVVSLMDVAPFAPAGRLIDAAADASRTASIAEKVGMTPSQLRDASLPGMAKSWVLSRKIEDIGFLGKRADSLVDLATGKPLTINDALDKWITANTGMGKTLSSLMKGMLNINDEGTDYEMALMRPAQMAMQALSRGKQKEVDGLIGRTDPRAKGKNQTQIETDDSIDPQVRTAYSAMESVRQWVSDQALASGSDVAKARPDGSIGIYHTAGEPSPVVKSARDLQSAQDALVAKMKPGEKITEDMRKWDAQAQQLNTAMGATWAQALQAVDKIDGKQRYHPVKVDEVGRKSAPRYVTIDIKKQAEELLGTHGPGVATSGDDGIIGKVQDAVRENDFASVKALTEVAMRRLGGNGVKSIDASLDPSFVALRQQLEALHQYATKRIERDTQFEKLILGHGKRAGGPGYQGLRTELKAYLKARRDYARTVRDHPTADWIDVVKDQYAKKLIDNEDRYGAISSLSKQLRKPKEKGGYGWSEDKIQKLRTDPTKLAQLIKLEADAAFSNPLGPEILGQSDHVELMSSAVDEANKLRAQGFEVAYIPHVSSLDIRDTDPGKYGVHLNPKGAAKKSSRAFERKLDFTAQRHDVTASLHLAAKEALQRDATIEFAEHNLTPHMVSHAQAHATIMREFGDEVSRFSTDTQTAKDLEESILRDRFHMVKYDPQAKFGFTLPSWDAEGMYIPKSIADAVDKMLVKGQFPMEGFYSRVTKTFRFAILGLSPRYTAHVVFGGTFLLALRSSPRVLSAIPEAWKIIKDTGDVPRGTFSGATQRGVDPVVYRSFEDDTRNKGSQVFHRAGGSQGARWLAEEHIEKVQGLKLAAAKPVHWLKAVGDLNYKFTNTASAFQRAVAYVDAYNNIKRQGEFTDPVTGEKFSVTSDHAKNAAMQHSLKVMGDLKAMTPLERGVFSNVMPFYGWTKHILQFVGTYPVDHPLRTQFLTVLAEQNSMDVASGLPTRLQFLMFLGSPDAQGNVSAVDARSFDPLRDVANYATLAGLISSLNPVITAPLAVIDPSIIFGGNPLYPNVTYDQFYGIESAGSQGSPLNALEQVIPQVSALDAALNLSGQYRTLAAGNPNAFAKKIFEALNIPFAQVQHLNLKQIAAKDELDRYHVASTAASNAWQSGDFAAISGLSSVPDPQNPDYEVAPGYVQGLYNQLLQEYPGQAPSETAVPPPPAPL